MQNFISHRSFLKGESLHHRNRASLAKVSIRKDNTTILQSCIESEFC